MTRLRLSVTKLENFRLLRSGLDWYTYERFASDLDPAQREATEAMDVGNMVHELAEHAQEIDLDDATEDVLIYGYTGEVVTWDNVNGHEVSTPSRYEMDLGTTEAASFLAACTGVHEVSLDQVVDTPTGPVRITGRVDAIDGDTLRDYKAKIGRQPDHVSRTDSYQWRNYLWLTSALRFDYREVRLGRVKGEPNRFRIDSWEDCTHWRYPGMEQDCRRLVHDAASFIRSRPELEALCIDTDTEAA